MGTARGGKRKKSERGEGGRTPLPGSPAIELASLHLSRLEGTTHARKRFIQTKERQKLRVSKTHYSLSRVCKAISSKLYRHSGGDLMGERVYVGARGVFPWHCALVV